MIITTVRNYFSIADNVSIEPAGHELNYVPTSPVFNPGRNPFSQTFAHHPLVPQARTTIGNDVWIGIGAMIKAGVNIGNGAVVGMGSVVTKDVPPYAIVAGNPARVIRERFDREIRKKIEESRWWEYSEADLSATAPLFNNPETFMESLR